MDSGNLTLASSTHPLMPNYNSSEKLLRSKVASEKVVFLQSLDLNLWKYGIRAFYCIGCVGNLVTIMVLRR